jgi:hypothetical protein
LPPLRVVGDPAQLALMSTSAKLEKRKKIEIIMTRLTERKKLFEDSLLLPNPKNKNLKEKKREKSKS